MRLMTAEKGEETPMEKYIRFKKDINLWYQEMDKYGLTKEEQKIVEPYFKSSFGVPPSQEALMRMLMDPNICNFSLAEANQARKIVGKKLMDEIPKLKEKTLAQAKSPCLGNYIWKCGIGPQMGYSFSIIHALAYSFIGVQTVILSTHWNPIYWNTACLIVNSGSLEQEDIKNQKEKSTNYGKIAGAIGKITSRGVKVSLVDINNSSYGFRPDIKNNAILFGLKGVNKVGTNVVEEIIAKRPYKSLKDFLNRCPQTKTVMISLIKAGAFDNTEKWAKEIFPEAPRKAILIYYIDRICGKKNKLTLQNFSGLLKENLIPSKFKKEIGIYQINKFFKHSVYIQDGYYSTISTDRKCLLIDNEKLEEYFSPIIDSIKMQDNVLLIPIKIWDKYYKNSMDRIRDWLKENQKDILEQYNKCLFLNEWEKYGSGTISAWEMESVCFYSHAHELANVNTHQYGLVDFFQLPSEPQAEYYFKRKGHDIPIWKTYKIAGTVLDKNDARSSVVLLTPTGVVTVKFTKEYYTMYKRQISAINEDGVKKVIEKSWFTRGRKILVTGYRREDTFVTKTYKHTPTHQLYLIEDINEKGELTLRHDRQQGNYFDE